MSNEPALILGLVQSAIALVVGFGLKLSAEQVGLIMALASSLMAVCIRQQVQPYNSTLLKRGIAQGQRSTMFTQSRPLLDNNP